MSDGNLFLLGYSEFLIHLIADRTHFAHLTALSLCISVPQNLNNAVDAVSRRGETGFNLDNNRYAKLISGLYRARSSKVIIVSSVKLAEIHP